MSNRKSKNVDSQQVKRIQLVRLASRQSCIAEMASKNCFLWYEERIEILVRLVFMRAS